MHEKCRVLSTEMYGISRVERDIGLLALVESMYPVMLEQDDDQSTGAQSDAVYANG